ncbi:VWA domain-containing protein, partial [Candidatus Woesearchaeota archaeon]
VIIFVSDGEPDDEGRPWSIFNKVAELANKGICVHTIGYGNLISRNSTAEKVLKGMAERSEEITGCGAYHYAPQDSALLQEIFSEIYEDILRKGALLINDEVTVDYKNALLSVRAWLESSFNNRPVPGISLKDASCSPPPILELEVWKDKDLKRKQQFYYDRDAGYTAELTGLPPGNYTLMISAVSLTAGGEQCAFRGTKTERIEIAKPLGFDSCSVLSCSEIGDYIAYSESFKNKVLINITDTSFEPPSIRVSEGTRIIWKNTGTKNHSVASDYFSSPVLEPGETFEFLVGKDQAGRYLEYYDPLSNTSGLLASSRKGYSAFGANRSVDLMLVMDTSGSMSGTPMEAAKNASQRFVSMLYKADRAGIISFSDDARIVHPFSSEPESLSRAIAKLHAGGGTSYLAALQAAEKHFKGFARPGAAKMVIFMSDGKPWDAGKEEIIQKVKQMVSEGICVYTVGFGAEVGADEEAIDILRSMADISKRDKRCGEYYYELKSAETLSKIFGEIYKEVLTLESLEVNVSSPLVFEAGSKVSVSANVYSAYNRKPIPGYEHSSCVPPARVKAVLLKNGNPAAEAALNYTVNGYSAAIPNVREGLYELTVDATSVTSTGKTCNFYGSTSVPLFVRSSSDYRKSLPVFNFIIFAFSLLCSLYFSYLIVKSRGHQEKL